MNNYLLKLKHFWYGKWQTRWRSRYFTILFVIVTITIGVSTTAWLSYRFLYNFILANLQENALLKVRQKRDEIDYWLQTGQHDINGIANTPVVRQMNWSLSQEYLKSEVQRLQIFRHLALMYPDGSYYVTGLGKVSHRVKDRPYFQKAIAGIPAISDPLMSRSTKAVSIIIAAPIWSAQPELVQPVGVMSGIINVERIQEIVSSLHYGPNSYALALASDGVPIVYPHSKIISDVDRPGPSLLKSNNPELVSLSKLMLSKSSGAKLISLDGELVYVIYLPLTKADWSIALVIPQTNLEKDLSPLNVLAIVISCLLAIASLVALWQISTAEQNRAWAEKEALMNSLSGHIRASLNIDQILQNTSEEVKKILNLEQVAFGWYNQHEPYLKIQPEYKVNSADHSCQLIVVNNQGKLLNYHPDEFTYLTIPVDSQYKLIGYLICLAPFGRLWSQTDQELLKSVASQLGIAIGQSNLYTQTQAQVAQLDQALTELKKAQAYLVQSEKMSSLGQMVAGIAHEINNPVNFIYGNIPHANQYVNDLLELLTLYKTSLPVIPSHIIDFEKEIEIVYIKRDLPELFDSMQSGAERIREIVLSLRNFARLDESDKKLVNLHEGIENSLLLLKHRLKSIQVIKNYGDLALVECYAGQLNQVFINILNNAIDAVMEQTEKPPQITITTRIKNNTWAVVKIADNGLGIPGDIMDKVFDPFFTTKPVGKGTGLGLTICYRIVTEVNQGKISIATPITGGTEIIIEIPI